MRQGLKRGLEKAIVVFLAARHGAVPAAVVEQIATLSAGQAEALIRFLPQCQTLDELAQWMHG